MEEISEWSIRSKSRFDTLEVGRQVLAPGKMLWNPLLQPRWVCLHGNYDGGKS